MSDSKKLCMGCMNPLPEGRKECGICGYPANGNNDALYLPVRTVLSERYIVGRLLESVGDAAVYLGYDQVLKAPILIREFLPDTLCERMPSGELSIISGCENTFYEYFEKFRSHARALARMRELTLVVTIYDIFEQNHTAYTVSEFCEGNSLETRLKQVGGRIRWEEARPLFMPLLTSLVSLHSAGIYHLGICPKNLIIGSDGKLHLNGFCIAEARTVSTDLRPQLVPGYSSPEQYLYEKNIGMWSDVYGLAATIFRTITGNSPPDGSKRSKDSNDLFVPTEVAEQLPDYVAAALFNALQVDPESRTRTVEQFRDQLSTAPAVSALRNDDKQEEKAVLVEETDEPPKKKNNNKKYVLLIVLAVFIILLLIAGTAVLLIYPNIFSPGNKPEDISTQTTETTTTGITTTATTKPDIQAPQSIVSDVVGQNYFDIRDKSFTGGMKLEVEYKQYSNKPKGQILSQTPKAESTADEGTTIKVIISDGSDTITVPNVTGWNYQRAKLYLEALGLRVKEMRVVSNEYDVDIVEKVSNMGQRLKEGSTVTIRISNTPKTTAAIANTTLPQQ